MAAKADVAAIAANAIDGIAKEPIGDAKLEQSRSSLPCFDLSAASKMTYDRLLV